MPDRDPSGTEADRGRSAEADDLRRRLPSASPAFLDGAIGNPNLRPDELTLLLRNPRVTGALLGRIGRDRRWNRVPEIRRALARHPRTPYAIARALLPVLPWPDLADVARDPVAPPAIRRDAESVLAARIPELSVGERMALARRATRGLVAALCECLEEPVLDAVLSNPRLAEPEALRIATRRDVPAGILRRLAEDGSWGNRPEVRWALLRNPRTPVAAALRLAAGLGLPDLEALSSDESAPRIVRVGAGRRLHAASG